MSYFSSLERMAIQESREEGRREGRQQGRQEALQQSVLHVVEYRLGPAPREIKRRLLALSAEQLAPLLDIALAASSLSAFSVALQAANEEQPEPANVRHAGEFSA